MKYLSLRMILVVTMAAAAIWMQSSAIGASATGARLGEPAWVGSVGGTLTDEAFGLALDGDGNSIAVGSFQGSADFDPGAGSLILQSAGVADAYVVKLGPDGILQWAVSVGGTRTTVAHDVAVDAGGDIYVVGSFEGETDFDPGLGQRRISSNGASDIFLLRLDSGGNLVRVTTLGSEKSDAGYAVDVDGRGQIYITGEFEDEMKVGDPDGYNVLLQSEGQDDVFVIRYANDGQLLRAWTLTGDGDAAGRDIVVDAGGNVYVAGEFEGKIDLDPDLDDVHRSEGDEDIFLAKYDDGADQKWGATFGGLEEDERPSIDVDASGNIFMTGNFEATADFDPSPAEYMVTSQGEEDIFLLQLNSSGLLEWAYGIGGFDADRGEDILVGHHADLFVTGSFKATVDFDPQSGQSNLSSAGEKDVFLARYATNGYFLEVQAMSGPGEDIGYALALDTANAAYAAGSYQETVNFNAGGTDQSIASQGDRDAFVAKRTYSINPYGPVAAYLPLIGMEGSAASAQE